MIENRETIEGTLLGKKFKNPLYTRHWPSLWCKVGPYCWPGRPVCESLSLTCRCLFQAGLFWIGVMKTSLPTHQMWQLDQWAFTLWRCVSRSHFWHQNLTFKDDVLLLQRHWGDLGMAAHKIPKTHSYDNPSSNSAADKDQLHIFYNFCCFMGFPNYKKAL